MLQFELDIPKEGLEAFIRSLPEAEKAGLQRVADPAQALAVRKAVAIRRRRVPTRREVALYNQAQRNSPNKRAIRASNDPAWEPSGELVESIEAAPIWDGPDAVFLAADVPYAPSRHGLGVDWMPSKPALGIIRKDEFFSDTVEVLEPQAGELFADGWNDYQESH